MSGRFAKDILSEINSFLENPKSIQHQIDILGKGISRLKPKDPFLKKIDDFIRSIDRIPKIPLSLNRTLCQVANEEVKKYYRNNSTYNPYLTGNQLKGIVWGILSQNIALLADSGADEAEKVVPKLLLNRMDKEKKGKKCYTLQNIHKLVLLVENMMVKIIMLFYLLIMILMKMELQIYPK